MRELIEEVNDGNFDRAVLQSDRPVLVDFWAPWCGPCRALGPRLEEVAAGRADRARVMKLNVDANPCSTARFSIRAIPTLILFKDGREVERLLGAANKTEIELRLDRHIESGLGREKPDGNTTV